MKTAIYLDVPEWQIGQEVSVYFPDSMQKKGKCEPLKEQDERYTWVKPEDRMPDTDGVCLIITDNGIGMVEYHSETKQFDGYTDHGWVKMEGVKWWCHAPKLPKK